MTTPLQQPTTIPVAFGNGLLRASPIIVLLTIVFWVLGRTSAPSLKIDGKSPHGMVSLQLSDSAKTAKAIVSTWQSQTVSGNDSPNGETLIDVAVKNLKNDDFDIRVYLVSLALALCCAHWRLDSTRSNAWILDAVSLLCGLSLVAAAASDCGFENPGLGAFLNHPDTITEEAVAKVRFAAQIKFSLLSLVVAWLTTSIFAIIRRTVIERSQDAERGHRRFSELYRAEQVVRRDPTPPSVAAMGDEPWIQDQPEELVGLALSGGGIRSSTFNLGLLQGLHFLKLLPMFDYLSTVSGGGYIGSWWSAWRKRFADKNPTESRADLKVFPTKRPDQPEPDEVRHLREFSNFLAPRWGLFETEMWIALIAVMFGLGPTLLTGVVVLAIAQMCWLVTTTHLSLPNTFWVLPFVVVAPLAAVLFFAEEAWRKNRKSDQSKTPSTTYFGTAGFALILSCLISFYGPRWVESSDFWMHPHGVSQVSTAGTWASWLQHLGIETSLSRSKEPIPNTTTLTGEFKFAVGGNATEGNATAASGTTTINANLSPSPQKLSWHFSARLFEVPAIWLVVGLAISVLRVWVGSSLPRECAAKHSPAVDRVLLRLLALGVVFVAAGLLWELGVVLYRGGHLGKASIGAAGSGGLFALMRNWLAQLQSNQQKDTKWDALKPYVPQLLAYVTVALMYALVVAAVMTFLKDSPSNWMFAWFVCWLCIAFALHLDPSEFGLHKLYRDRLTRAFLGASHPNAFDTETNSFVARKNRYTDVRQNDDLPLTDLKSVKAPLHLVCCTANHLSGDQLSTLSRGARSAVLSCCGLSIGDRWAERPEISLGDAVTASAAAFNSLMGGVSIKLGPAVGFLMSVLNLRLGIWVASPGSAKPQPRWFRGLLFLHEMFGLSDSSDQSKSHVHLSDAGQFENMALYELIRRHCRYIIVSDCGADPYSTFEDFGNAVRRIREDFGVDIDIDLDPLRPGSDGKSKQHVAVGTIRFDPNGKDFDVGVLIFFKPALTGDESSDVTNYRALNPAFPHESTGDQFYDEAQWESYRRLGAHSVMAALGFMEGNNTVNSTQGSSAAAKRIQSVFNEARNKWYPTPPDFDRTLVEINGRFVALEQRLAEKAPAWFVKELCPELEPIATKRAQADLVAPANPGDRLTEEREAIHLLVQMIQLIEDVWLVADLGRNFNHPKMLGWMNAFGRWTHTKTFRIWWPYLGPLYTPGMRAFAKEHFQLGNSADQNKIESGNSADPNEDFFAPYEVSAAIYGTPDNDVVREVVNRATIDGKFASDHAPNSAAQKFEYVVFRILSKDVELQGQQKIDLPFAVLRYVDDNQLDIRWNDADFLIAHGMWGTGLGTEALREWLRFDGVNRKSCVVTVDLTRTPGTGYGKNDEGHRRERNDVLNFYKRLGFVQDNDNDVGMVQLVRKRSP